MSSTLVLQKQESTTDRRPRHCPGVLGGRQSHRAEAADVAADTEGTGSLLPQPTADLAATTSTFYPYCTIRSSSNCIRNPVVKRKLPHELPAHCWNPSSHHHGHCLLPPQQHPLSWTSECPPPELTSTPRVLHRRAGGGGRW